MTSHSAQETDEKSRVEMDDGFVYYVDLPTLQEIASYRVCRSVWYSYVSSPRYILKWRNRSALDLIPYLGAKITYKEDIVRLIEGLRTPRRIEEMLKKGARKILDELADWARHLGSEIFPDCMGEYSLMQIDSGWCVWTANGEIDYRKSAQKMLNSGRLDDTQKFVVMSKYCMEDEIETVSLESLPKCIDKVTYDNDCVLYYWICLARYGLHFKKLPFPNPSTMDDIMVKQCLMDTRMALEYLWHRSSVVKKIDEGCSLVDVVLGYCDNERTWSILERLLASLDSNSTTSYCVEKKLMVSSIFSKSSRYPLWLWDRCKHLITDEKFHELISGILYKCIHVEEKMKLLTHIWDTADDSHRNYTLSTWGHHFVQHFHASFGGNGAGATAWQFLCKYVLLLPPEDRLRCFHDYPTFLINIPDFDSLDNVLEMCSVDRRELSRVKEAVASSSTLRGLVESSIINCNFERLNVILDWLFSDEGPDAVRAFKKKVLQRKCDVDVAFFLHGRLTFLSDFEKWKKLCNYIDEAYAEDTLSALSAKQSFVYRLIKNFSFGWYFRDVFDAAKEIVESVYSSEELDGFKRDLLSDFCVELKKWDYWQLEENCDERFFQNFIDWCCGGDQVAISRFKCEAPPDALVTAVLDRLGNYDMYESQRPVVAGILLDRLQKYLLWYLGSEQCVKEYKLRKINDLSADLTFLKNHYASCFMVILKWFFNGSETNINEYISKNESGSSFENVKKFRRKE